MVASIACVCRSHCLLVTVASFVMHTHWSEEWRNKQNKAAASVHKGIRGSIRAAHSVRWVWLVRHTSQDHKYTVLLPWINFTFLKFFSGSSWHLCSTVYFLLFCFGVWWWFWWSLFVLFFFFDALFKVGIDKCVIHMNNPLSIFSSNLLHHLLSPNSFVPVTSMMRFSELSLLCGALSLSWQPVYFDSTRLNLAQVCAEAPSFHLFLQEQECVRLF